MKRKIKNIYECFNEYTFDEVNTVIDHLNEKDIMLLHIRYGNDFSSNIINSSWSSKYNSLFYSGLIPRMRRRLKRIRDGKDVLSNRDKKVVQSIYECLRLYTVYEVDDVIRTLDSDDIELLHRRYGENLRGNTLSSEWHSKYNYDFYNKLIPKMKRRLEKMRIHKSNGKSLDFSKENESVNKEFFNFLKDSEIRNIFSLLEPYKAFIISLRFGYIDGKCYSVEKISEKLKISPKTVIKNIRDGLITYRDLVNKNVQIKIDSIGDEVMKLCLKNESNN